MNSGRGSFSQFWCPSTQIASQQNTHYDSDPGPTFIKIVFKIPLFATSISGAWPGSKQGWNADAGDVDGDVEVPCDVWGRAQFPGSLRR